MYFKNLNVKCQVVKKVTDRDTFLCLKPANVVLYSATLSGNSPLVVCMDCARNLAKEAIDSVPNGRLDGTKREAFRG